MNFLSCLTTASIKLSLRIKFLGICVLYTLIFSGPVKAQTFNTPGPITFTVPNFSGSIDPGDLVIVDIDLIIVGAGGGGGRGNGAGGGGGGQVIQMTITASEGDILTGTIGSGGLGGTSSNQSGTQGNLTAFAGITAQGGFGGEGGNAGDGGASGSGQAGGNGNAISSPGRQSGGGGAGAIGAGDNSFVSSSTTIGGNGGLGILGFGGGGGGTRNGGGGGSIEGSGSDGGTPGSSGNALDATNGGGGGGGINSGGDGGNGIVIVTVNFRVLPVEFLYFKSSYKSSPRSGDLSWSTAKEWENSHFEIERSVNNLNSWETIGQVQGAGYSDQPVEYKYQDLKLPLTGGNIFYRLKQVDLNGKSIFSDTKAIQVMSTEGSTIWRVFPNPTTGDVINLEMLEKVNYKEGKVNLRLISPTGQIEIISGFPSSELSWQLSDLLKRKTEGVYTLEINWGKNREYHKVILSR